MLCFIQRMKAAFARKSTKAATKTAPTYAEIMRAKRGRFKARRGKK